MPVTCSVNVVGCHCAGEVCNAIVAGVLMAKRGWRLHSPLSTLHSLDSLAHVAEIMKRILG